MRFSEEEFKRHVALTKDTQEAEAKALQNELKHAPLFGSDVTRYLGDHPYSQYGVLGNQQSHHREGILVKSSNQGATNAIYGNHAEPWSAFICGSQGSGKSYTLANLLENCILPEDKLKAGHNPNPMAAIAFHYDKLSSDKVTQYCELAYFCSVGVPVRIVVSPSNYPRMKRLYSELPGLDKGSVTVIPLKMQEKHLRVENMMALMNVKEGDTTPLYLAVIWGILRELAEEDPTREGINYEAFCKKLEQRDFQEAQIKMLDLRLMLLEECLDLPQEKKFRTAKNQKAKKDKGKRVPNKSHQNKHELSTDELWSFQPGTLTIVDLSSPYVNEGDACAFFSICLNLFMAGRDKIPRVVVLDEAHKFLNTQIADAKKLTEGLMSIIRQQRHLSARVIIATQEPELDTRLLDLCNVTIVHQFNSPDWYRALKKHLAGTRVIGGDESIDAELFSRIVDLLSGSALLFSPKAMLHVEVRSRVSQAERQTR